jgi:uncharacterized cupin superfamily protein
MRRVNLFDVELKPGDDDPDGYRAVGAYVGRDLGSAEYGFNVFEIPAGESICPYHYEYVEEWLLVLEGTATVRVPEGEEQVHPGDAVLFPAGPDGAHKVMNRGEAPVRLIFFSSNREPSVAVYPDGDKVGVWTPNRHDKWMFRGAEGHRDYWDGEL